MLPCSIPMCSRLVASITRLGNTEKFRFVDFGSRRIKDLHRAIGAFSDFFSVSLIPAAVLAFRGRVLSSSKRPLDDEPGNNDQRHGEDAPGREDRGVWQPDYIP